MDNHSIVNLLYRYLLELYEYRLTQVILIIFILGKLYAKFKRGKLELVYDKQNTLFNDFVDKTKIA